MQKLSKCISAFLSLFMLCPLVCGMKPLTDKQMERVIGNQPYYSPSNLTALTALGPHPVPSPSEYARQLAEEKKRNDELAKQLYDYGEYCKKTGKPLCVIN